MGFQKKIFLWMLGALVAILVPALMLVESKLKEKARERIEIQFENQVQLVLSERERRLDGVRETATKLAQSSAVKRSLRGDLSEDEKRAFAEEVLAMRPVARKPQRNAEGRGARRDDPGRQNPVGQLNSLLPVLLTVGPDDEIEELTPSRDGRQSIRRRIKFRRDGRLRQLDFGSIASQQVGYVINDVDGRGHRLREVIGTPVKDGDEILGVFMMGIDAETQVDHLISRIKRSSVRETVSTGFFSDGEVIQLKGLDEVDRGELSGLVGARIEGEEGAADLDLGDEPYRFAWQELSPGSIFGSTYQIAFFPQGGVRAEVRNLQLKLLLIGGGAVVLAALASYLISHSLAKPVKVLEEATRRLGDGDFSARVAVRSKDEIGRLAASFNEMAKGLALKERYREVLSKVSDESVAQSLIEGELELGGETRFLTVLFCDIRGFTSLTESMDPHGVIDMLNAHMTAMTEVVYAHRGVVDKFIGDEIMAVFGAPKEYGDDHLNALRCALAMITRRAELNSDGGHRFEIGIGLASGEMVAGCMGSVDRLNYTVLGERVNLAARLCSKAGPGEVIAAVDEGIAEGEHLQFDVRGFSEQVRAIRVSGVAPAGAGTGGSVSPA